MRLDKFLKISRLIKRRSVANGACNAGRVEINGKVAKSGTPVSINDVIQISFGNNVVKVRVDAIKDTTKKEDADSMFTYLNE